MKIDPQNLKTLLEEKKYEEIKALVKQAVDEPMSDSDKGAFLVDFTSAYIKMINDINAGYISILEEAIESLEMVNKAENETVDKIKLEEVKKDLNI